MIDDELVRAHRARALNPEHPFIRGTAQNPDTFFQAREAVNPFTPGCLPLCSQRWMQFAALTGRQYRLFDYQGPEDAERVVILMGSGAETARETAAALQRGRESRRTSGASLPAFSASHFLAALPAPAARLPSSNKPRSLGLRVSRSILMLSNRSPRPCRVPAVDDAQGHRRPLRAILEDFSPGMAKAVFDELKKPDPKNSFTVGINDDVSTPAWRSIQTTRSNPNDVVRAVFYGLGSDGTVGANKNSVKIIAEDAGLYAQGYFVYDSHKSGAQTVSHLRFGPRPIRSPYLISSANFLGCHQFHFLERQDVLRLAGTGATFLLNSPYGPDTVWDHLPRSVQQQIIDKKLKFFVIDATRVAQEVGLKSHTNTVLQTCFFALSGVLPREQAISQIKASIRKTYGAKGDAVVQQNFKAVDDTLSRLHQVTVPAEAASQFDRPAAVPANAPEFVILVTAKMFEGRGDEIPVSLMPVDGTFPSGTAAWEKRNIADEVPVWRTDLCVQCGQCSFVCPHSVIRAKYYDESRLEGAPQTFKSAPVMLADIRMSASLCSSTSRIARGAVFAWKVVRHIARRSWHQGHQS